jgi:hypothetical protein
MRIKTNAQHGIFADRFYGQWLYDLSPEFNGWCSCIIIACLPLTGTEIENDFHAAAGKNRILKCQVRIGFVRVVAFDILL